MQLGSLLHLFTSYNDCLNLQFSCMFQECKQCNRFFTYKVTFHNHVQVHHGGNVKKVGRKMLVSSGHAQFDSHFFQLCFLLAFLDKFFSVYLIIGLCH